MKNIELEEEWAEVSQSDKRSSLLLKRMYTMISPKNIYQLSPENYLIKNEWAEASKSDKRSSLLQKCVKCYYPKICMV